MRSDCADSRFTDTDQTTLLPFWLESGCNSASTRFWIRVPTIPASTTKVIYLYYGDPSATSTSSFNQTFLDPNGDFELDAAGTSQSALSYWDHESGTTGENGSADWAIVSGSTPCAETGAISTSRRYSSSKSLQSYLKNCNTGGNSNPLTRAAVQRFFVESAYRAVASSDTLYLWMSAVTYTTSSRWRWSMAVILGDGTNSTTIPELCKCWGNNEGCPNNAYDYYDQSATGADGQQWKRYPIAIPSNFNKTTLTFKIAHLHDTWDGTTANSTVYYDLASEFRLRRYRAPEPATASDAEQTR